MNGGLSGACLVLMHDQAPRCKQAKLAEKLAFKKKGWGGLGRKKS